GWRTPQGIYALAVAFIAVGAIITSALAYEHASATTGGGVDFQPSATVTVEGLNRKVSVVTVTVALGWKSTPPPVVAEACSYARALVMMAPTAMKATASA